MEAPVLDRREGPLRVSSVSSPAPRDRAVDLATCAAAPSRRVSPGPSAAGGTSVAATHTAIARLWSRRGGARIGCRHSVAMSSRARERFLGEHGPERRAPASTAQPPPPAARPPGHASNQATDTAPARTAGASVPPHAAQPRAARPLSPSLTGTQAPLRQPPAHVRHQSQLIGSRSRPIPPRHEILNEPRRDSRQRPTVVRGCDSLLTLSCLERFPALSIGVASTRARAAGVLPKKVRRPGLLSESGCAVTFPRSRHLPCDAAPDAGLRPGPLAGMEG
jgi:hypothetical protein